MLQPAKRASLQEDISPIDRSIGSARKTSRGPFSNKDLKEIGDSLPVRRPSIKVPTSLKMEPLSPGLIQPKPHADEIEISNSEVATFFKMVRQKKLTADEFIYMIRKNQNDHYNMQVVPYS